MNDLLNFAEQIQETVYENIRLKKEIERLQKVEKQWLDYLHESNEKHDKFVKDIFHSLIPTSK